MPSETLNYAQPTTQQRGPRSAVAWLWIPTTLFIAPGFYFVPLARHIWSCTEGEAWCMLSGTLFGFPFGLAALTYSIFGLAYLIGSRKGPHARLRIITAIGLLIPPLYMFGLFAAMIHHG